MRYARTAEGAYQIARRPTDLDLPTSSYPDSARLNPNETTLHTIPFLGIPSTTDIRLQSRILWTTFLHPFK